MVTNRFVFKFIQTLQKKYLHFLFEFIKQIVKTNGSSGNHVQSKKEKLKEDKKNTLHAKVMHSK